MKYNLIWHLIFKHCDRDFITSLKQVKFNLIYLSFQNKEDMA